MSRDIRYVSPNELIAYLEGMPMCVCCVEEVATIDYDCDYLCTGCAQALAARGEPIARQGRPIKPRRRR